MPPEKRIKASIPSLGLVDGFEVPVMESTERWTEIKLEDGSVLRVKPLVIGAIRVEGKFDNDGNPVYSLKMNQIVTVASAPEHLKKSAHQSTQKH